MGHAVDSRDLGHDKTAYPPDDIIRQLHAVRRHCAGALYRTQGNRTLIGTPVAHDANARDAGQRREALSYGVLNDWQADASALLKTDRNS